MNRLPLVLAPALGADARLWQPVIDLLDDGVECLVIRGDGGSLPAMADDVLERAPARFALAGISMGGYVALEIALRHTPRVAGLALINTSAIAAPPDRLQNSMALIELVESGGFDEAVERISVSVARGRPDVAAVSASMAHDLGPDVFLDQQRAVAARRDRRDELPGISMPTLILTGEADTITPTALGEEMAALIPRAELLTIEGAGHFSPLEAPEQVAAHLERWLDALDS